MCPETALLSYHKLCLLLRAQPPGNPLYEAQNSDFLRRKVADLRQNWRNCAKKYLRKFDACVDACVEFSSYANFALSLYIRAKFSQKKQQSGDGRVGKAAARETKSPGFE